MASPFLKRYLLAVNRYKWLGLFTFLSVLGIFSVAAFRPKAPPEYSSKGVLVDNSPLVAFSNTSSQVQTQGLGIINEEFLLSDVLLSGVSAQLASEHGIEISEQELVRKTRLEVIPPENNDGPNAQGQRVEVLFVGDDPAVTETVLTTMFEAMVELSKATNSARLNSIKEELDARLPEIENNLREAEQTLEAYDRIEGPAIQASIDGSLLGAISGSQEQLRANQITLAGIEAQMNNIQSQLGMNPNEAYASSALSADPLVAQLRGQIADVETNLAVQRNQGLRDQHPIIVELEENRAAFQSLLAQRASEVLGGSVAPGRAQANLDPARAALANALVDLDAQRDAILSQQLVIRDSAGQLREQYASLPNKQLERNRLATEVAIRRDLFERLQASLVDAQAAEAETVSSLVVASPPFTFSSEPDQTSPLVLLLAGGALGALAAGGLIYLLDMLDGTVRTAEELEEVLQSQEVPMLGLIPAMKTRSPRAVPVLLQPESAYNASYERLLSRLRLVGNEDSAIGPRMIVITSTRAKEGKSITAYNLAIASARAGRRTLLVEADLRSGSRAEMLGLMIDPQATLEPLRYYSGQVGEPLQMVSQVQNLYVCPSPGPQRQPAAILESSEMQRFLKDARSRFDMVILDTPSLTRCDDALLLEEASDGILLTTRPGVTEKAVLDTAIEELELSDDVRLLGVVVNAASVGMAQLMAAKNETDLDGEYEVAQTPEMVRTGSTADRIDF